MTDDEKRSKNAAKSRAFRAKNPTYMRDVMRRARAQDPERVAAVKRRYDENHREALSARARAWRAAHPDRVHGWKVKKAYGVTAERYAAMLTAQGGRCAVCNGTATKRRLHVDHDHATGVVRGLLCHHCNVGLGHFKDDTGLLLGAVAYLRRHKT